MLHLSQWKKQYKSGQRLRKFKFMTTAKNFKTVEI